MARDSLNRDEKVAAFRADGYIYTRRNELRRRDMWKFKTKREAQQHANRFGHRVAKYGSRWILLGNGQPGFAIGDHGWLYPTTGEVQHVAS